jgi:midasin (ATPase involved in ribosome maturation)
MSEETDPQEPASAHADELPEKVVEAIALSNAFSIGEQPAMLANLALANQIFAANLAQQNAIVNQQVMFQVEFAALAKCLEALLAVNAGEADAIERVITRILEMFEQFNSKVEERLVAAQKQMSDLLDEMRAQAARDEPGES